MSTPEGISYPAAGLYGRIADLENAIRQIWIHSVVVTQSDPTLTHVTREELLVIGDICERAFQGGDANCHPEIQIESLGASNSAPVETSKAGAEPKQQGGSAL